MNEEEAPGEEQERAREENGNPQPQRKPPPGWIEIPLPGIGWMWISPHLTKYKSSHRKLRTAPGTEKYAQSNAKVAGAFVANLVVSRGNVLTVAVRAGSPLDWQPSLPSVEPLGEETFLELFSGFRCQLAPLEMDVAAAVAADPSLVILFEIRGITGRCFVRMIDAEDIAAQPQNNVPPVPEEQLVQEVENDAGDIAAAPEIDASPNEEEKSSQEAGNDVDDTAAEPTVDASLQNPDDHQAEMKDRSPLEELSSGDEQKKFSNGDHQEKFSNGDHQEKLSNGDHQEKFTTGDHQEKFSSGDHEDKALSTAATVNQKAMSPINTEKDMTKKNVIGSLPTCGFANSTGIVDTCPVPNTPTDSLPISSALSNFNLCPRRLFASGSSTRGRPSIETPYPHRFALPRSSPHPKKKLLTRRERDEANGVQSRERDRNKRRERQRDQPHGRDRNSSCGRDRSSSYGRERGESCKREREYVRGSDQSRGVNRNRAYQRERDLSYAIDRSQSHGRNYREFSRDSSQDSLRKSRNTQPHNPPGSGTRATVHRRQQLIRQKERLRKEKAEKNVSA